MNKKHKVIYYDEDVLIETTPKDWARANKDCFPEKDFKTKSTTPTSHQINRFLVEHKGFTLVANENNVICFRLI